MADLSTEILEAPGRERPDFTIFDFPAANLTDGSSEEIEIDQALSLQGRQGRDFLGAVVGGILGEFRTEWLTLGAADLDILLSIALNSRTGTFNIGDPEFIWGVEYIAAAASVGTDAGPAVMNVHKTDQDLGEGFLYVAPRLFWDVQNDMDRTISANQFQARLGSVSRRLTFNLFIELLERFADVTLL